MLILKVLLFSLSFLRLSFAAEPDNIGVDQMAMRACKDLAELPRYLDVLQERQDFEGFRHLASLYCINIRSNHFDMFAERLLQKDDKAYINALLENTHTPRLKEHLDFIRDQLTRKYRHAVRNVSEDEATGILSKAYEDKNMLMFKSIANEVYFQLSPSIKNLVDRLCADGAKTYLEAIATSILNEFNFELQEYMAVALRTKFQPARKGPVIPLVKSSPKARLLTSGGWYDMTSLSGKNGVYIKTTDQQHVFFLAILEGDASPTVPSQDGCNFDEWHKRLFEANSNDLVGMTIMLDLESKRCILKRAGNARASPYFFVINSNKQAHRDCQKFLDGYAEEAEISLSAGDDIVCVPSPRYVNGERDLRAAFTVLGRHWKYDDNASSGKEVSNTDSASIYAISIK